VIKIRSNAGEKVGHIEENREDIRDKALYRIFLWLLGRLINFRVNYKIE